jgi:glycosyltransferase involved in cell wall biosynthesis
MGSPLNILHVLGSFDLGGKETRTVQLMNSWGRQARHTLLIGNPEMDGARAIIDPGIDVRLAEDAPPIIGTPSPARMLAIANYLRPFDLILSYNWGAMDVVMAHRLFHSLLRLPPLIHHEDGFNVDEATELNTWRNTYRRAGLASAFALVVPSSQLAHIAIETWHQPCAKVHLIPNGIDVADFAKPPRPDAIPGLDKSDGRLVVGTVAGLRPVKHLSRLVRIAAPLAEKVRVVIVGEGPDRAAIQEQARLLGVEEPLMPGLLPQRPYEFEGLFDIFALTSDTEQFPISLVEAMAAGLPVVASDVGDICSMVSSCNRPYILAPYEEQELSKALAALVEDPALRRRLGDANRHKAVEAFDERGMIARYAKLYSEAVGSIALTV